MKNLFAKILLLQGKIKPILKSENNPYYSSKYFDINTVIGDVRPLLSEVGLVVMQPLTSIDGKAAISTIICDPESGESMERIFPLREGADIQKDGGIVTYTRRYALTSIFLLQGEDDDDGAAAATSNATPAKAAPAVEGTPVKAGAEKRCTSCNKVMAEGSKFAMCYTCNVKAKSVSA